MFQSIVNKFHPSVFHTGGKLHAIIAFILEQDGWTTPQLYSLSITSDGFVVSGDHFIGSVEDLERNLGGAAAHAGLTNVEAVYFEALYRSRTDDWRDRV